MTQAHTCGVGPENPLVSVKLGSVHVLSIHFRQSPSKSPRLMEIPNLFSIKVGDVRFGWIQKGASII